MLPTLHLLHWLLVCIACVNGLIVDGKNYMDMDTLEELSSLRLLQLQSRLQQNSGEKKLNTEQDGSTTMCLNTQVALTFEHHRVLDWVAYHNLLGINCFFLHIDICHSKVSPWNYDPTQIKVYDALRSIRLPFAHLIEIRGDKACTDYDRQVPTALIQDIQPTYVMNLDVDEFLVLGSPPQMGIGALEGLPVPASILTFLRARTLQDASDIYVNRWSYGTSGYTTDADVAQTVPEFASMVERIGTSSRNPSDLKKCEYFKSWMGKVIQTRVKPKWSNSVHGGIIENQTCYPDGSRPFRWEKILKRSENGKNMMDIARSHYLTSHVPYSAPRPQPLWINHYVTGSLEACLLKQKRSLAPRGRTKSECMAFHPGTTEYAGLEHMMGMVNDTILVQYGVATRTWVSELFNVSFS